MADLTQDQPGRYPRFGRIGAFWMLSAGIGASHQTGWTGLVGALIHFFGNIDPAHWAGGRPPPSAPAK